MTPLQFKLLIQSLVKLARIQPDLRVAIVTRCASTARPWQEYIQMFGVDVVRLLVLGDGDSPADGLDGIDLLIGNPESHDYVMKAAPGAVVLKVEYVV